MQVVQECVSKEHVSAHVSIVALLLRPKIILAQSTIDAMASARAETIVQVDNDLAPADVNPEPADLGF